MRPRVGAGKEKRRGCRRRQRPCGSKVQWSPDCPREGMPPKGHPAQAHVHTDMQASAQLSTPPHTHHGLKHTAGSRPQWAFTHTALSGLGVAGCGQSCMAKADDSGGGSEGHSLTEAPGKHCSESRSDFLGTCLGLPYGPA